MCMCLHSRMWLQLYIVIYCTCVYLQVTGMFPTSLSTSCLFTSPLQPSLLSNPSLISACCKTSLFCTYCLLQSKSVFLTPASIPLLVISSIPLFLKMIPETLSENHELEIHFYQFCRCINSIYMYHHYIHACHVRHDIHVDMSWVRPNACA